MTTHEANTRAELATDTAALIELLRDVYDYLTCQPTHFTNAAAPINTVQFVRRALSNIADAMIELPA